MPFSSRTPPRPAPASSASPPKGAPRRARSGGPARLALGAALATLAGAGAASAQAPGSASSPAAGASTNPTPGGAAPRPRAYGTPAEDDVNFAVPATRRGGLMLGFIVGGQLTGAEGTPLDYDERGDAFRASTGTTLGSTSALFVGGAFTDWFAFKVGFQQGAARSGDRKLASSGLLVGVETWPLFSLGGHYRDLGLLVDFGTGAATIENRDGDELANAGAYSQLRAGVVWDAFRFWKLNLGPTLAFEHTTSETFTQNALWFGLRTVFYGAP